MIAMLTGPQWPAEWRAVLCVGAVVRVSRDMRTDLSDPPDLDVFDALVTFVGVSGVVVRRGADGGGERDVVAYDDMRGYTLPGALPSPATAAERGR